jgi:hypothetical protein
MVSRPSLVPHDPDAVLEALMGRIGQMTHLAAALDQLGWHEKAAAVRASATDLAHLLNLLRNPAGEPRVLPHDARLS